MDIEDLLDVMIETIEGATTVPLTGKRMVDAEKMKDLINDVRLNMPSEIRKAKMLVDERERYIAAANQESENIIKKAEERARSLVNQQEITKQSKEQAAELLRSAQQRSKELQSNVTNYCESVLKKTEEQLTENVMDVKKLRSTLHKK